jgi:hypothetical protein
VTGFGVIWFGGVSSAGLLVLFRSLSFSLSLSRFLTVLEMVRVEEGDARVDISCKRFRNAVAAPPPPQSAFLGGRQKDRVDGVFPEWDGVAVGERYSGLLIARRILSPSHLLSTAEESSSAAGLAKRWVSRTLFPPGNRDLAAGV